ncbi:hypothetical protein B0H14DRAFT_252899 [Mycena olivaceomarginata]|nr:hypothetical protein B0H14DRAFT_252899 [Mycena olivaceomarginata]
MYPSSQVFLVSVSGIVALAPALFHGQEDHDDDVYRPFVSGFDGIERRAALISSRSPRPAHREYAAAVLAFPRVPRPPRPPCLSLPLTAFLKARALLSRRPVSDARTDHREATMSFLGTGGDAIHPRRAHNLRRVHFAYAVSITVLIPEDVPRAVVFADRLGPGTRLERH